MTINEVETTDSVEQTTNYPDVRDGLKRGALVRHTLFDRYDDPVFARVDEVVIPEVSRFEGGHAQLRSEEWEGTRTALLDNIAVEEPASTHRQSA